MELYYPNSAYILPENDSSWRSHESCSQVTVEYAVLNDAQPVPGAPASDLGETSAGIDRNDDRFKDLPRDATIKEQLWCERCKVGLEAWCEDWCLFSELFGCLGLKYEN